MSDKQLNCTTRILLVEDDESHAFLVSKALDQCTVASEYTIAQNGIEAIKQLKKEYQRGKPYDLVFMDLNMPRMDGRETLVEVQHDENLRKTPVVILTTSGNPKDVAECYLRGASSYIIKPFDLHELFATMELAMTFWFKFAQLPQRSQAKSFDE